MKCQNQFSCKNKKKISKCRLLKILPRVLSIKESDWFSLDPTSSTHSIQVHLFIYVALWVI